MTKRKRRYPILRYEFGCWRYYYNKHTSTTICAGTLAEAMDLLIRTYSGSVS